MSAASASRRGAITKQSRNRGHDCPRQFSRVEVARAQAGASSGTSANSLLSARRVARRESRAHRRKVAMVELILERLGARRQYDLAGREQRGDEISKGLAGAGARFA